VKSITENSKLKCYHCGDHCTDDSVRSEEKVFCCTGCKLVHELLKENNLCTYYELNQNPGSPQKAKPFKGRYQFLENPEVEKKLTSFTDGNISIASFHLPQIHCASCVWLLEHLHKLNAGIVSSRVDFIRKEITIEFQSERTKLRGVVETLAMAGYEPSLNLNNLDERLAKPINRSRIYKLVVAGFCFGNIMLLSFPEYFSIASSTDVQIQRLFAFLNLSLSLPVFFYSGSEFYKSAWRGYANKQLNIDAPIALAIIITFARSIFEIATGTGAGYLDSMSGIIFFMLIGRHFQELTHGSLSFDRDYKSYFPISITRIGNGMEEEIAVSELAATDKFLIRNGEIIPCDSRLLKGRAQIDYSFVNGESVPVEMKEGEFIYAGGKQTGASIELIAEKIVSQGWLTKLWNKEDFCKQKTFSTSFIHAVAKYFTVVLLAVAAISFFVWLPQSLDISLNALTSVLIVACPCALLLSATFTNGNVMRIFSRNKFYLKNSEVIEELSRINSVVFDKTGTITETRLRKIDFVGFLNDEEKNLIASAASQSSHPLSRSIVSFLNQTSSHPSDYFKENSGSGIVCEVDGHKLRLGSEKFIRGRFSGDVADTRVYVEIDDGVHGYFSFTTEFREGLSHVLDSIDEINEISLLSGDHASEAHQLRKLFGRNAILKFEQSPEEKMIFITQKQSEGKCVMMVGDGLNDAGALRKSNVGIAISDDANNFTPACDAVCASASFGLLPAFMKMSKVASHIIIISFIVSLLYNIIGLYYATTAQLHPVIAAILMPASSLTIILFTTGASWVAARRLGLE